MITPLKEGERFWMIWSPRGKRVPGFRHPTLESAKTEAIRLSEKLPGRHFYIFACLGYAMVGENIPTPRQLERAKKAMEAAQPSP